MSITTQLHSAIDYIDNIARQTLTNATAYLAMRTAIRTAREQADGLIAWVQADMADNGTSKRTAIATRTNEIAQTLLTTAISNTAPILFFKQVSEIRSHGTLPEVAQVQLIAQLALIFYYEKLIDGVDYQQLREFIDHAESLKSDVQSTIERVQSEPFTIAKNGCTNTTKASMITSLQAVIDRIDKLILQLGQSVVHTPTYQLDGRHHALVASYHLFGNVSKAYEITQLSGGVSGAELSRVAYYRDG